jgi:hypothetical protein
MIPDRACRVLAAQSLAPYRLSPAERHEEVERLAQDIQRIIAESLEALEHRRV